MSLPEYTAYQRAAAIPSFVIEEVRNRFLNEATKNPNEYYSEDVERILVNNWSVARYLIGPKIDANEGLRNLIASMKWRKSFGVRDLKESDFPRELYQSGNFFEYGVDRSGSSVFIGRAKVAKKFKSWYAVLLRWSVFMLEKMDQKCEGMGITLVSYCKDAGIQNTDLESMIIGLQIRRDYYPGLLKVMLVHKLPALLEPIFKTAISMFNEEEERHIIMTNEKNIHDYIARDQLPDFMLGTNQLSYRTVPESAPTADELAKRLGLKEGKAEKLVKHLEPFFND